MGVQLGPVRGELIAAVLRGKQRSGPGIDRETDRIAESRGEALAVGLRLPAAPRIEAPDAACDIENRAGILARGLRDAVLHLTGVRRRADVDVEHTVRADDDALRGMLAAVRQTADHGVGSAGGRQFADLPVPPADRVIVREVEILTRERDPIAAADPERADDISLPVAGPIAQHAHAAAPARDGDE